MVALTVALLTAATFIGLIDALVACPNGERIYTGASGMSYKLCPNSDLQGETVQGRGNVNSLEDCAAMCDENKNCYRGVYDHINRYCHVKAQGNMPWEPSQQFDVIQQDLREIARCPGQETSYSSNAVSGSWFSTSCFDTDWVCRRLTKFAALRTYVVLHFRCSAMSTHSTNVLIVALEMARVCK